jgi:hypothetical protein
MGRVSAVLGLAALAAWAGTPLAPEQAADITERASRAGWAVDLDGASETFEDPSVLFVPSPTDPGIMLLFDTLTKRAVLVLEQGSEGYHLSVVEASAEAPLQELDLGGDGYFGPEAGLLGLGLSDAILANTQASVCQEACFKQPNHLGCAACTGVAVLAALRDPGAWDPGPTPEPTSVEEPGATPEAGGSPQPTAGPQATATEPVPEPTPAVEPSPEATPGFEPSPEATAEPQPSPEATAEPSAAATEPGASPPPEPQATPTPESASEATPSPQPIESETPAPP